MDAERNKETIRRWAEVVWNRGNLAATPELVAEGFVCHYVPGLGEVRGREEHDRWVSGVRERNPSFRVEVLDLVAEGDKVASLWRATAYGMHLYRLEGGKIAEMWAVFDRSPA